MQSAPLLPDTAPFAEEQIAALNRVISVTTAEQRAWLSGYLAGLQAANDPHAAVPAAPPAKRVPLTILFGTESGNAEALAAQARKAAAKLGFAPKVVDMADFTLAQAAGHRKPADRRLHLGRGRPAATRRRLFRNADGRRCAALRKDPLRRAGAGRPGLRAVLRDRPQDR